MMGLNFYIISHFITGIVAVIFGLIVFLKDKKSSVNRAFGFLNFGVAVWSLSYGVWLLSKNPGTALFWARTLNLGATLIPVFYLHWIINLLKQKRRRILLYFYILTFIFASYSYSDFYISGVKKILQFPYWPQLNWLYILFLIFGWGGMIIYGLVSLFEELKGATGFYREQIKYVIWGSVIGFVGGSTNFPLMMGFSWFPPLGSPLVIAYPVLFGYAMVRHRLMDIKFILRQSSVYLLSLLTVLAVVLGARIVYGRFLPASVKWLDLVILVLALYVFPYIRDYYYRIANKYFFSSLYDSRELIAKLSDGLRSTLDVNQIYNLISSTLISALHIKAFGVLNYNEASGQYLVQFNSGFNVGERKVFPGDRVLHEQFIKKSKSIVVEELKATSYKEHKEIIDLLSGVSAAVVVPLNIKDETLGVMVLGQKESADMYNDEDLRTLEIISSQAAIAIKNAQLYDETKEFSLTLQREVERQTAQLKQANIELQRLDRAKSDFISIASHQLRTPLTTIKGFTSMILEGTYGRISAKLRDKVEKVFESSERLIRLVNDLLDLSHMEGGKMEFNFAKVDFDKMVESVVEELKPQAQKKKLKLQISLPHRELWVWADEQKLRQVVMNLVDNAIKYTEKGEVGVLLKEKNSFTQLAVRDSGIGMKPQDVERLFQKFVRGIEAPRYYTEGAGIGLYVAKQLIEAQKGRIWAESAGEDQGSTFYIKMPNYRQRVSKSVN